ncbi:hypothetical protein OS493_008218 [Desmophyllum pertusum]|uniref:G-protein coupled receptors family 1 profile domain-containing protein n=1 Tax=Desmophyllum pertusum TaxID=174260 RepID=A0A9X0A3V3_9CNID|nr:hypothetical protein OS493_008218 [Desmophyllum pertusum]
MSASVNLYSNASIDDVGVSSNNTSLQENCALTGVLVCPSQVTITIHVITLLASLVGNTLLITVFVRIKEPIMLLIANMAVSDLLVAIFLIPRLITREIIASNAFLVHGNGGQFLCKMCTFLSDISLSVSTLSLMSIAVERFLAVVYPIEYKKITVKVRRFLVASTWIMAMAFHSPYFYTMRLVANGNHQECQSSWEPAFDNRSAHLRYNIFLFITVLLIPLLVISVLYIVIVIKLRKDTMASYRSERGARRKRERNRNLQRMVVATVTAFLICWTLYSVIHFLKLFSPWTVPKCSKSFKIVDYISRLLASSYCAVNPCICFIFVRNFSCELSIMFKRKGQLPAANRLRKVREDTGASDSCGIELQRSCSNS